MKKLVTLVLFVHTFCAMAQKDYKGAELYSTESWKYGKIELRMRMAKGSGILSTFFTYKNGSEVKGSFWEEIDIEVFGKDNAETFQSNIITNNPQKHSEKVHSPGFSLGDAYHTYTLEWTPNYVAWYIDGVEMRKTQGGQVSELTRPESFRFNLWASSSESWVGEFDTDALPAYQFVNWIRYSAYTPGTGTNGTDFTLDWEDDFSSFDSDRWNMANWTFNGNLVDFEPDNVLVEDGYLVLALTKADETGFKGIIPSDEDPSRLQDDKVAAPLLAFPNPTTSILTLQSPLENDWSLYDLVGEKVAQGHTTQIDMKDLPNGSYFLHVKNAVQRIVKK